MFLTKECDYAMRIVRALSDFERKSVHSICESEHIPVHFAYKILKKLECTQVVSSTRGAFGGYKLSKALEEISLFDIASAANENLLINECLKAGHVCLNNTENKRCKVHTELASIQDELVRMLGAKTMDELV